MTQLDHPASAPTLSSAIVAGALAIGVAFPQIAMAFYPYMLAALFFIVAFSLNTLDEKPTALLKSFDRLSLLVVGWQMVFIPSVALSLCVILGASSVLTMIMLAVTTAGSVFSSPTLVHMIGLDRVLAMRIMILSTASMPFSLMFFGKLSGVLTFDISFTHYFKQVVYYLVAPMALAYLFWKVRPRLGPRTRRVAKEVMSGGAMLAVVVFTIGVMAPIHITTGGHSNVIPGYAILAASLSLTMYFVTVRCFASFGYRIAMTVAMLAANRNVALSFALLSTIFPSDVIVYLAISQFAIFLSPLVVQVGRAVLKRTGRRRGAAS